MFRAVSISYFLIIRKFQRKKNKTVNKGEYTTRRSDCTYSNLYQPQRLFIPKTFVDLREDARDAN